MSVRQMQADLTRMGDALGLIGYVTNKMNEDYDATMRSSINIGGDPSLIAITGRWEKLGDYAKFRASLLDDDELQSAIRVGGDLFTGAADFLVQVRKEAGEPGAIAAVNTARMRMPRVADAFPFAMEVAEVVENITGNAVGIANAVTGDRSQLMWYGFSDDLDTFAEDQAKLEGNEDYVGLYKRSEDLMVDGSLEQSLWQAIG